MMPKFKTLIGNRLQLATLLPSFIYRFTFRNLEENGILEQTLLTEKVKTIKQKK
jgi:hypothetical protein